MGDIVIEFKNTGPCLVDIKEVAKAWDYRFLISEYENDFQVQICLLSSFPGEKKVRALLT